MKRFGEYHRKGKKFTKSQEKAEIIFKKNQMIIVRLDGINFTGKYLNKFNDDLKEIFYKLMKSTVQHMLTVNKHIKIAYTHCDEINLLIDGNDFYLNDKNRNSKINSYYSSLATKTMIEKANVIDCSDELYLEFKNNILFSTKVFNVEYKYIREYLLWRQFAVLYKESENKPTKINHKHYGTFYFNNKKTKDMQSYTIDLSLYNIKYNHKNHKHYLERKTLE